MRESKTIDLAVQKSFIPFLDNVVLIEKAATIAHVRSYLGAPDSRSMGEGGPCYEYSLNCAAPKTRGVATGRIELQFGPDTTLQSARVTFYRYFGPSAARKGASSPVPEMPSHALAPWELKTLGLPVREGDGP